MNSAPPENPSKWRLFGVVAVFIIAYVVLTGGLLVSSRDEFPFRQGKKDANGLRTDLMLRPEPYEWHLPLLFYWVRHGGPFDLNIQIWDDNEQYQSIELTDIVLVYADGERVDYHKPWSKSFEAYSRTNGVATSIAYDELEGVVRRFSDVTITLTGTLTTVKGDRHPFEVAEAFTAKSRSYVSTFWLELMRL